MFTGIVEEMGTVQRFETNPKQTRLAVSANKVLEGTRLGDSICVNGVCLTVDDLHEGVFSVGVAPETLKRTNLGELRKGQRVNLERALTPSSRMGGHYVQGHVDGTAVIKARRRDRDSLWIEFKAPPDLMKYIVSKGFICVDGVSLTVVNVTSDRFNLMLVAYTQQEVTLPQKSIGDRVNIEVDIMAKYAERLLGSSGR